MDAVAEGGTVHVAEGTYEESVTVEKPLSLVGEGGEVIVRADTSSNAIYIQASGVLVRGFRVEGGRDGIRAERVANITISNCIVANSSRKGVVAWLSYNVSIIDCVVANVSDTGVKVHYSEKLLIEGCNVQAIEYGLYLQGADLTLRNCIAHDSNIGVYFSD